MAAQIVIKLDDAGKLSVTGPLDQKILCYGLLEAARDIVRLHEAEPPRRVSIAEPFLRPGRPV